MTNQTMSSDTKHLESRGYVGDFNFENISPNKGLEPLTSGLKVPRSTDWTNTAYL